MLSWQLGPGGRYVQCHFHLPLSTFFFFFLPSGIESKTFFFPPFDGDFDSTVEYRLSLHVSLLLYDCDRTQGLHINHCHSTTQLARIKKKHPKHKKNHSIFLVLFIFPPQKTKQIKSNKNIHFFFVWSHMYWLWLI